MDRIDPAILAAEQPPADPGDAVLAAAAGGRMALGELLDAVGGATPVARAAQLYEAWLAHTDSPHKFIAWFNYGVLLGGLSQPGKAERAYREALAIKPDFVQARLNLGHQLERLGRPDDALVQWQAAAELPAAAAETALRLHALNNRARLLEQLKRYDESEACMVQSLNIDPAQPDVLQHYVHIRQKQCAWPAELPVGRVTPHQLLMGTSPLAMLGASDDPALQLLAATKFLHTKAKLPANLKPLPAVLPRRSGKLRIGYLSGDLCMHAVGLMVPELLELHDRSRFEVYGFCWSREDGSAQRARLVKAMDKLVRIDQLNDEQAAQAIRAHGIDILVDLQGITSGARPAILAYRAAPIQATYLGYPGTTALPGVDYVIADRFLIPEAELPYYSERPIYLETGFQVSDRQRVVGPVPTRAQAGLPEDAFVYCSFNNNFKFTPDVFAAWMRILAAVPGSVLWLLADNPWAKENMLRVADAHGVARERLVFAPRVLPADYLARFALVDLYLDTTPYNAGTTASDALFVGAPLLTWSGRSFVSRMAGSLLHAVGLPDLVAYSLAEYEQRAIQIGREPNRAASYKRYLAEHRLSSPLFDMPARVKDLEGHFQRLAKAA